MLHTYIHNSRAYGLLTAHVVNFSDGSARPLCWVPGLLAECRADVAISKVAARFDMGATRHSPAETYTIPFLCICTMSGCAMCAVSNVIEGTSAVGWFQ